jgi:phosphatidylserine/phosphatidylglycerophosphate/cardiolipin synthase-like enzyme
MTSEYHFENIEYFVKRELSDAKSRVLIAVAWLTNVSICEVLIKLKLLSIEIIVDDKVTNRTSVCVQMLNQAGIQIAFIKDMSHVHYLMHNKFCVIDQQTVITGSYNWTLNANHNHENIAVIHDQETALQYAQRFRSIKEGKNIRQEYSYKEIEREEIISQLKQS